MVIPAQKQWLMEPRIDAEERTPGELREANHNLREFQATLAHELRNPLAAIRNGLYLLEQQGDDAVMREWARAMMERQIKLMSHLVEDLLQIARIEHGKIQLSKQEIDLGDTVSRAVETVRSSVDKRGHRLDVSLPRQRMTLHADPDRLEQILTNLLNNAVKYMEPGGRIWVTVESDSGEGVVRVRDSGIGIAAEMIAHIFDPFRQVERTRDHAQGGLGIGLALVRKLAEMHGGSITARSEGVGRGSEFTLRLPAVADEQATVRCVAEKQQACACLA